MSGAATRSQQVLWMDMAKEPPATHQRSLCWPSVPVAGWHLELSPAHAREASARRAPRFRETASAGCAGTSAGGAGWPVPVRRR